MSYEISPIDWFKHHTWGVHLSKISISKIWEATKIPNQSNDGGIKNRFIVKFIKKGSVVTERVENSN